MSAKKIILTGGGTAGHVFPNLALLPLLREAGMEVYYIGTKNSIEEELAAKAGIPFFAVFAGKLRRDRRVSLKNLKDILGTFKGIAEASAVIKKLKPSAVFSKGGFVGLPVSIAARLRRVPLILHESDLSPGLANRLVMSRASVICASFPETLEHLPKGKAVLTGNPIRRELFDGERNKGLELCGFSGVRPIILLTGGSLGAVTLNNILLESLPELLPKYDIIHLCGKGKISDTRQAGYKAFEFLGDGLPNVLAAADIVISRAGAGAINEFLALRKPALLIPLGRATRGDQQQNAESFAKRGFSRVLSENELTKESFIENINELYENRLAYIGSMEKSPGKDAAGEVFGVIEKQLMVNS